MDLNILISTIITATAALVAIIGGFLVSRVITMASEKQSIERRLKEIDNDLKIKKEMLDNIENLIFEDDINEFIQDHCEELIIEEKNLQEILCENDYYELNEEDLKPYVEELISIRDRLNETMERSEDIPVEFKDFINQNKFQIDGRKDWYELVYTILRKERLGSRSWSLHMIDPKIISPHVSVYNAQIYRDRIKNRDQLRSEVEFLTIRKNEQQKILDDYKKTSGLWSGLAVLVYACIVGIAYPSLLLPYPEGIYDDKKTKWLLIALFFSALFVIFTYLAVSIYKLTQRK